MSRSRFRFYVIYCRGKVRLGISPPITAYAGMVDANRENRTLNCIIIHVNAWSVAIRWQARLETAARTSFFLTSPRTTTRYYTIRSSIAPRQLHASPLLYYIHSVHHDIYTIYTTCTYVAVDAVYKTRGYKVQSLTELKMASIDPNVANYERGKNEKKLLLKIVKTDKKRRCFWKCV